MPSDVPGKESRVCRKPVGVVAVMALRTTRLWLSSRSVAPALAEVNGVGDSVSEDSSNPGWLTASA
jgi:aldehyde dehydrogenase (NAD+)